MVLEALMALYEKKLTLQQIRAQKEQEQIARNFAEARAIDGVGALTMQVHADAYHQIAHDMGGYEIWQEKSFVKHFLNRAPECKVKCGGTKIQQGYRGPVVGVERNVRWSRKYEDGGSKVEGGSQTAGETPAALSERRPEQSTRLDEVAA